MAVSLRHLVPPKSARSHVWNHFGFASDDLGNVDKSCVYCKICGARIAYCGNTTNMLLHLTRCMKTMMAQEEPQPSSPPLAIAHPQPTTITNTLVEFLVRDLWPLELAEGPGFFKLLAAASQPSYLVPSTQYLADVIATLANDKRKLLADELLSVEHVCLSIDEWQSVHGHHYLSISCHFIDGEWNLQARFLEAAKLPNVTNVQTMSIALNDVLDKWNLKGKALAVLIKDSESILAKALENLGLDIILCTLNLLTKCIQRGLDVPTIKELVIKTKNTAAYFIENEQSKLLLKKLCEEKGLMVSEEDVHDNLKLLGHCTAEVNSLVPPELAVTEEEAFFISELLPVLEPLTEAVGYLGGDRPVHASVVLPLFHNLGRTLQLAPEDCPQVRKFKEAVAEVASSCQDRGKSLLCASALDPRFKSLKFLQSQVDRDDVWNRLHEEAMMNERLPDLKTPQSRRLIRLLADEEEETTSCSERHRSEVRRYLAELRCEEEPVSWWSQAGDQYPLLSVLARKYLALLAVAPSKAEARRSMLGMAAGDILFLHDFIAHIQDGSAL